MAIDWQILFKHAERILWLCRDLTYKAPEERAQMTHEKEATAMIRELGAMLGEEGGALAYPSRDELVSMLQLATKAALDKSNECASLRYALDLHKSTSTSTPIPIRLPCPSCHELHIDIGERATTAHHTHACQFCGAVWRPALADTVGVQFLPGFKNEPPAPRKVWRDEISGKLQSTHVPLLDPDFKREVLGAPVPMCTCSMEHRDAGKRIHEEDCEFWTWKRNTSKET